MNEDIYIRVDEPDTVFTEEEKLNWRDISHTETCVLDGKLYYKRSVLYQRQRGQEMSWLGFARVRPQDGKGDKHDTLEAVKDLMDKVISETSTHTKNTLMKYVRENFDGKSHIKDVGKVVPKIIKEQLTRSGKWETVTKKKYIRIRQKG